MTRTLTALIVTTAVAALSIIANVGQYLVERELMDSLVSCHSEVYTLDQRPPEPTIAYVTVYVYSDDPNVLLQSLLGDDDMSQYFAPFYMPDGVDPTQLDPNDLGCPGEDSMTQYFDVSEIPIDSNGRFGGHWVP